ncbi:MULTISPECIES: MFS transporter [unclassified Nocardia]|uniref:MFS transporter n=1 Tax=unclassified Nocardia TaxID=2637762 RepID=UPI001CE4A994|nr:MULTISPECIES: MFS transporter [unclassified Nocardia]
MTIPATTPRAGPVVAVIVLGTILNPLDATMVAVALAPMHTYFGVSVAEVSLLVTSFFVAGAVGQTLMGKLAEVFGARRVLRSGLLAVAISCALAPFAPSLGWLIVLRVGQALGSSVAFPTGMTIIRRQLTRAPAQAMGAVTTANTLSAAVGPYVGGLLVSWMGWQAIFFANIPVALLAVALAGRLLPPDPPHSREIARVDVPGAGLYTATLVAMLVFLLGLGSPASWIALAAAVPLMAGFLLWERRTREPFLDIRLMVRQLVLLGVFAQYALANVAYYGMLFAVPTWLQVARGTDPATTGLVLVPMAVCSAALTPLAAYWIHRRGPAATLCTASVVLAVGGALLFTVQTGTSLVLVAIYSVLAGIHNNPNTLGLQAVLYQHTATEQTGTVSGVFQSFRYIGSILSTALLGLAFGHQASDGAIRLFAATLFAVGVLITIMNVGRRAKSRGREVDSPSTAR